MSHNKQITLIMNTNNVTNISDDFVYFQCICDTSVLWLVWTVTKTVSFRQQHSFPFFIRNQFHFNNSTHMTSNIAQPYHTTLRTAHIDVNKEEGKRNSCDQKGHCKWATERHEKALFVKKFTVVAWRKFVCSGKENLIPVVSLQADNSGIEIETTFLWYIK